MANVIKLRKGLNIHLKGTAAQTKRVVGACTEYVVRPDTFEGVVPKLVVHEGDRVDVGDALFVDKNFPEVRFASPVSGTPCWRLVCLAIYTNCLTPCLPIRRQCRRASLFPHCATCP